MRIRTSAGVLFALAAIAQPGESFKDERLVKLAAETVKARAAARGFLLDTRRYAMPAQALRGWRVGIDIQPGHDEMERLVSAAIIRHNKATALLAEKMGVRTRTVGHKRPTLEPLAITRPVNVYGITVIDTDIAKFLKRYRKQAAKGDALEVALGALAREEWSKAAKAGAKLKGVEAFVWETARAASVLVWNEKHRAKHGSAERDGLRVVNAYRASLGLPPFILDKQLRYMARDFAVAMANGRFFSHQHPTDPTRRTLRRRAQRARYGGGVAENVSTQRDAVKAVWEWRADAGHHRVLVYPNFRAAGLGCTSVSVFNVGDSTREKIFALYD